MIFYCPPSLQTPRVCWCLIIPDFVIEFNEDRLLSFLEKKKPLQSSSVLHGNTFFKNKSSLPAYCCLVSTINVSEKSTIKNIAKHC